MFWFLLLPILVLVPFLEDFLFLPGAAYTDLLISHYPNALFLRQSLTTWHQIPLWSDNILSGYPFAADPLSGLWYPPGWLAVILPLPLAFNLTVALHLILAGAGAYLFLRSERLVPWAAVLGAVTFEAMPKFFAHIAAGHVTLIYAVAWTPWLLWAERRQRLASNIPRFRFFPAIFLALIALADPRWVPFTGALWAAYSLAMVGLPDAVHDSDAPSTLQAKIWVYLKWLGRFLGNIAVQATVAACLAAPLLLPLMQFTSLSTRAGMKVQDFFTFSLPPEKLFGLLFPNPSGNAEWTIYPGGLTLVAGLFVVAVPRRVGLKWFWLGVAVLSILYSLGSYMPFLNFLAFLPGLDLLRVPSRAMFLACFAFSVLTAYGAQLLLESRPDLSLKRIPAANLLLAAIATLTILLLGGTYYLGGILPWNYLLGCAAILAAIGWLILRRNNWIPGSVFALGAIVLVLANLSVVDRLSIDPRPAAQVLSPAEDAASYLASQGNLFRIYSPSYSIPQQTAALFGLQLADGIDPLQLSNYTNFMQHATGVPMNTYSVTLPPFATGDPEADNSTDRPDPQALGLLNVRFVVSEFDLPVDGLVLRARLGSTRVYENEAARPRAWIEGSPATPTVPGASVAVLRWSPNQIDLFASGGGRLVLSEMAYPGWQVWVDGHRAENLTAYGLLRAVELPPGEHRVTYLFRPTSVYLGLTLTAIAITGIFFYTLFRSKAAWKKANAAG